MGFSYGGPTVMAAAAMALLPAADPSHAEVLTTHHSLLTAHYSRLLTAHCSLLTTTHYLLLAPTHQRTNAPAHQRTNAPTHQLHQLHQCTNVPMRQCLLLTMAILTKALGRMAGVVIYLLWLYSLWLYLLWLYSPRRWAAWRGW